MLSKRKKLITSPYALQKKSASGSKQRVFCKLKAALLFGVEWRALMLNTIDVEGKARRPSTKQVPKRMSGKDTYDKSY